MKILVTGATGFIGRPLCAELHEAGHQIVVTSRRVERARALLPFAEAHTWAPQSEPAPAAALEGCDAIVNLMGETVLGRWTDEKIAAIADSRVLGTRNLVAGIESTQQRPKALISSSAIGYYGDRGDEVLDEDSPAGPEQFGSLCTEWEAAAQSAEPLGLRVVVVRTGVVLARGGGALEQSLLPAKLGLGGPLGSGKQWWAWIHRDDLVGIFLFALDSAAAGALAGSGPNPVRQKEFARVLGRVLGRPAFLPVPAFVLKLLFGRFSFELLSSKRIEPRRLVQLGYRFRYPELEGALRDLLS